MTALEKIARAIDPADWSRWDDYCGLKGYTPEEAKEEFSRASSLHRSLARAEAAIDAIEVDDARVEVAKRALHLADSAWDSQQDSMRAALKAFLRSLLEGDTGK